MMIARATGDYNVNAAAFETARQQVLSDPVGRREAPESVRVCREPDAVWDYVTGHFLTLDDYKSRRQMFRREFEPLLSALETFESSPIDDLVEARAASLNASSVEAIWRKALERRAADPDGAVTAARTLLESTCKVILDDRRVSYAEREDLPGLYRLVSDALNIAPSQHTEGQFRAILGACTTVVKELGALRNRASDSHGAGRRSYRPAKRHAALAVNLAGAMALFLMQTHEARSKP